jgi:hypothetical protein
LEKSLKTLPKESLFAAYDLLRTSLSDVRVSAFFLEPQKVSTVAGMINHVTSTLGEAAPYNLRIVTLQLSCNLLSNSMAKHVLFSPESSAMVQDLVNLVTANLLDKDHAPARVAAASLAFNLAALNHKQRVSESEELSADSQLELVAALIEAFGNEDEDEESEVLVGVTMVLALFVYLAPVDGEVLELGKTMDLGQTAKARKSIILKNSASGEAGKQAVEVLVKVFQT